MEIKEELMQEARSGGICKDGYEYMRTCNVDKLIDYYIQNPDWCLERNYPTLNYLEEHFADKQCKGIYVGEKFNGELLDEKQVYIFHNCKGTIKVGLNIKKAIIPMLYIANNCRIKIVGVGEDGMRQSEVPIYIFGKNDVSAHNNKYVKFNKYETDLIV